MLLLILVFLLGELWRTEAVSVTGVMGKAVSIKCSHSNAFSNVKYFCKGVCGYEDVLISSKRNKIDSNEKYGIKDEGNIFHVTISHLTEDDSGTYWCGIDRVGLDTYVEVVLAVIKGNTKDPGGDSNSNASSSKKLVYIGAGLGVVVLALAMVLLIFFRHRNRPTNQASLGKDHGTVYATLSSQKQDVHHFTTTDGEDQETDSRTENVFSLSTVQHRDTRDRSDTVSSESLQQPDGLLYSTVSFNKHAGGSTVTAHTAELTYSEVSCDV